MRDILQANLKVEDPMRVQVVGAGAAEITQPLPIVLDELVVGGGEHDPRRLAPLLRDLGPLAIYLYNDLFGPHAI
jgi:hypothetical protein